MASEEIQSSGYSAAALAERFGLALAGDGSARVSGACALTPGRKGGLAFADNPRRSALVAQSAASIIVLPSELAELAPSAALIAESPRLMFARIAALFERPSPVSGIAASAVVDPSAVIDPSASIGAQAVVGAHCHIGSHTVVGAGTVIGDDVTVGERCVLGARVSLLPGSRLGARVRIGAGAVIGERGFGLVPGPAGLEAVPQLGGVVIEDDVEIGANSTIDRGALDDTLLRSGVKIDNQVHIAHNCVIGSHTVIAGCTGIAGSCVIGERCMIGGGVGIADHVTIADGVVVTAASQVPKNIDSEGVYSSTFRAMPAHSWRKRLALFRSLDRIEARLKRVETTNGISGDPHE
ncbi:UDP-3-O-(3-hydroxymyristoyl)glucosamine N-acyltransferase [Salinisphaera sp. SPP-AMP-43]|uniref:UDP-3-O-(3-hydroxymyristoyl)glucosamine N-acyltransferase n=1 Tax=Salinisphaera sp. SPP-AMP-43 TaxID=3121288 RepID=UPI003C6E53F4